MIGAQRHKVFLSIDKLWMCQSAHEMMDDNGVFEDAMKGTEEAIRVIVQILIAFRKVKAKGRRIAPAPFLSTAAFQSALLVERCSALQGFPCLQ